MDHHHLLQLAHMVEQLAREKKKGRAEKVVKYSKKKAEFLPKKIKMCTNNFLTTLLKITKINNKIKNYKYH